MPNLLVSSNAAELAQAAAKHITERAIAVVRERGTFSFVLAGGSTPRSVYSLLATSHRSEFPWQQTHFFWGDERHVPPTDPESNFRMAWESMLSRVLVPSENIHRIHAEDEDADNAARAYSEEIRAGLAVTSGALPVFDFVLLGIGPDGHTASLFPHTTALRVTDRLVVTNWVDKLKSIRITMTVPLLTNARETAFLVQGAEKAPAVKEILEGEYRPDLYPAQLIAKKASSVTWMLDQNSASLLTSAKESLHER